MSVVSVSLKIISVVGAAAALGAGLPTIPGVALVQRVADFCSKHEGKLEDLSGALETLNSTLDTLVEDGGATEGLDDPGAQRRVAVHQQPGLEAFLNMFVSDVRARAVAGVHRTIMDSGAVVYQSRCDLADSRPSPVADAGKVKKK